MILIVSSTIIFLVSFILAIRSVKKELSIPDEVQGMHARQRIAHPQSGAIMFLREKIVHYSSEKPVSDSKGDNS